MEIASINNQCLRIKGKKTTFLIDPQSLSIKTPADAIIELNPGSHNENQKVEGSRITMDAPGEYEVGGVKISAIGSKEKVVFHLDIDAVALLLGKAANIEALQEKIKQSAVALIHADETVKPGLIPSLECALVVLYGSRAVELAKTLGKETAPVTRISVTADKLPAETEIVVLG